MPNAQDLVKKVKSEISEITVDDVKQAGRNGNGQVLVDVREREEWVEGFIPGAHWIPRGFLELRIEEQVPDKDRPVVLYCAGGTRSALGARTLRELGYTKVSSMRGGFTRWKEAGFPIEIPKTLSTEQKSRYSRHLLVPA